MKRTMAAAIFATCCVSLSVGCASTPTSNPWDESPSMNARRFAKLQELAAKDTNCTADQLVHMYLGENQHKMTGCGTDAVLELRCMMGSCAWISDLRTRAAFDLNCDREKIAVQKVDKNTSGATGCGKRATYVINAMDGSWIMNSQVSQ